MLLELGSAETETADMVRMVNVLKMQKTLGRLLEQVDAKGNQYVGR